MKIIEKYIGDSCTTPYLGKKGQSAILIKWDIPMDAIEGKLYDITVQGIDEFGQIEEITFPIKVPKTKPIQTKIKNNELIVTDKNSTLYGMKMKGHSGEDISAVKLRSVEYRNVWRKRARPLDSSKEIERIVYIVDNVPNQFDMKFPPYMDNFEEERMKKGISIYQYLSSNCIVDDCWGWRYGDDILYDNTDGTIVPKTYYTEENSKLFMININTK